MKANIVKELQRGMQKRKSENATNPVIQEVNKLLEYDSARDNQVLDMIAPNSSLSQSKNEMAAMIELEKREDFYSGEIFTKEQIVKIGAKYRLKFLRSDNYKAYIDPKVVLDIRDIERHISDSMTKEQAIKRNMTIEDYIATNGETKFQFDAHQLKSNFFILAPASCFKTEKTAAFLVKVSDPIMFYTDDGNYYRVIRKWGSDFTVFRRLLGWVTKSPIKHVFRLYVFPLLAISVILSAIIAWKIMAAAICISIIAVIFLILLAADVLELDSEFTGDEYVTSTNSYYI